MFNPSQTDVRRFFCQVYAKTQNKASGADLSALEQIAALWISEHPEYWGDFADLGAALGRNYNAHSTEGSRTNPFLHLSMHLSVSEQCSIDQPPGVRAALAHLAKRRGNLHAAQHEAMEYLGQMLWQAQQSGKAPDGQAYVAALQHCATRD